MIALEKLEEPINENGIDEDDNLLEDEECRSKNSKGAPSNIQKHLLLQIMFIWNERGIFNIIGKARSMMNHVGFDDNFKKKFWCEAYQQPANLTILWSNIWEENLSTICSSKTTQILEISHNF